MRLSAPGGGSGVRLSAPGEGVVVVSVHYSLCGRFN